MILKWLLLLFFGFLNSCSTSKSTRANQIPEDDVLFPEQSEFIRNGNEVKLPASNSYYASFDNKDLQTLAELEIKVDGNRLISKSGKVFKQHPFKNLYHLEFFEKIEDLRKSDNVYAGIEKHLLKSTMKEKYREFILVWLADFAIFLGSKDMYLLKRLESDMTKHLGKIPSSDFEDIKNTMTKFFSELSMQEKEGFDPKPSRNILIVTTRGGGGHYSTAMAMKEFLEHHTKYQPIVYSLDDLEKDSEPLLHISELHSLSSAFNEFSQKEGNSNKFSRYTRINPKLNLYYPSRLVSMLREAIVRENAFLVLNTCVFVNKTAGASYSLDVPQIFVTTDFDFWNPMTNLILYSDPKLTKVTLTAPVPSVFYDFVWRINKAKYPISPEISQLQTNYQDQKELNNSIAKIPTILPFGYPTREGIRKFSTEEKQNALKKRNLKADSKIAMLMMGAQGKKGIDTILNALTNEPRIEEHLDKLYILVGKNEATKLELEKLRKTFPQQVASIFEILGLQNAEEMSELYNISKFVISKPGGSTTAELTRLAKPIIMFNNNYGEAGNKRFLEKSGLGYNAYSVSEIAKIIVQEKIPDEIHLEAQYEPLDWKVNLLNAVEEFERKGTSEKEDL